jgi:hypothetical protein
MTLILFITSTFRLIVLFCFVGSVSLAANEFDRLVITAPPNGMIVSPGDVVVVGIRSESNTDLVDVTVEGDQGLGIAADFSNNNLKFTVNKGVPLGPYSLVAKAKDNVGKDLQSVPVVIDVERSDFPDSLVVYPPVIKAELQGPSVPLVVVGHFPDNTETLLTRSINISFRSTNPNVATITTAGDVRADGIGDAMIVASYRMGDLSKSVTMGVSVPSPVLRITPAVLSIGASSVGVQSPPQLLSVENLTYDRNVSVENISVSGDFTQTNSCMDKEHLNPGEACYVLLAVVPESPGQKRGILSVSSSALATPLLVEVSAEFVQDADFDLKVTPSSKTSELGDELTFEVAVTPIEGFSGPVELVATGIPAGMAVKFLPSIVPEGRGSVAATITTSNIREAKAYSVEIVGKGGYVIHHANLNFVLVEPIHLAPHRWAGGGALRFLGVLVKPPSLCPLRHLL